MSYYWSLFNKLTQLVDVNIYLYKLNHSLKIFCSKELEIVVSGFLKNLIIALTTTLPL